MYLHAIHSCTLLCPNLGAQIIAYAAMGFSVLSRAPLASERALQLGLSGQFNSAQLAPTGATHAYFELIEMAQPHEACVWSALRLRVPKVTLSDLAEAGFEPLAASDSAFRGPAGETLYLSEISADRTTHALFAAELACDAPKLSAAFYLGLGAPANISGKFDAGVELASGHHLEFVAKNASSERRYGIYAISLARRGTRGQAGPARILRGPDQELIELL